MKPKATRCKATRCRVCLKDAAGWHEPDAKGVRWAVRLIAEPDGAWICTDCRTGETVTEEHGEKR